MGFTLLDYSGEKQVNAEEFVVGLMQIKGNAKRADILEVKTQLWKVRTDIKRLVKLVKDRAHLEQSFGFRSSPSARSHGQSIRSTDTLQSLPSFATFNSDKTMESQ